MRLNKRIRDLRYAKGWGPDDLATRAQISRTALYQIESGKTEVPRAGTLRRIARALGVSPEALLRDLNGEPEAPVADEGAFADGGPVAPALVDEAQAHEAAPVPAPTSAPIAAAPARSFSLRDFELEYKFRALLASPLRESLARIVDESFRLLPREEPTPMD